MPQSLVQIYLHLVYSTKDRLPHLSNVADRKRVHAYLVGICENLECPVLQIGGVSDHVHILCRFQSRLEVKDLLAELKRDSSKFTKTLSPELKKFYWQAGYGAFSVSPSHVDELIKYIMNQEEHHKHESFQDEFRRLLKKYKIEYDERYVWD